MVNTFSLLQHVSRNKRTQTKLEFDIIQIYREKCAWKENEKNRLNSPVSCHEPRSTVPAGNWLGRLREYTNRFLRLRSIRKQVKNRIDDRILTKLRNWNTKTVSNLARAWGPCNFSCNSEPSISNKINTISLGLSSCDLAFQTWLSSLRCWTLTHCMMIW